MATVSKQIIFGGTANEPTTDGVANFNSLFGPGDESGWSTVANGANVLNIFPTAGKLSNFRVRLTTAPGAGNSWAFTILINDVDSALSVTIADTATTSSTDTDQVSVAAGDRVYISAIGTSVPTGAGDVQWTCDFTPTISGETILMGHNDAITTALDYTPLSGYKTGSTTRFLGQNVCPLAGTFKKLYVWLGTAPGGVTNRTFKIEVDSVDSAVAVTIAGAATTGNDTSNTVAITAGGLVSLEQTAITGSPANTHLAWGIVFVPTLGEGYFWAGCNTTTSTTTTPFALLIGEGSSTTENGKQMLTLATTAKSIYVALDADPGTAPDAYTFTLRQNQTTDTALAVTIVADNTTGNASTDVSLSAGDGISTKIAPVSTPSVAPQALISYAFFNTPITVGVTGAPPTLLFMGVG